MQQLLFVGIVNGVSAFRAELRKFLSLGKLPSAFIALDLFAGSFAAAFGAEFACVLRAALAGPRARCSRFFLAAFGAEGACVLCTAFTGPTIVGGRRAADA